MKLPEIREKLSDPIVQTATLLLNPLFSRAISTAMPSGTSKNNPHIAGNSIFVSLVLFLSLGHRATDGNSASLVFRIVSE